nr:hypothetical protein [Tanacetum cinerariifolium]
KYVRPTFLPRIVAGEGIPYERSAVTFPRRQVAGESHPQRQVAGESLKLSLRKALNDAFGNKQYKPEDTLELFRDLFNDVQNIREELAEYINTPGCNRPAFYNSDDDDDEDCTITITSDFLITDSLSMGDEHLNTIPEKESDEFIKSCVENLVPITSESEDFSDIESECDVPDCDDSQTTHFSTFSNHLFDDSTSSDDQSSHEESYLLESLLNRDESIPLGIDNDDSDFEGDNLFLERLLHDDPIILPDTLDFSNVVRVFLPFFTYPVTSPVLLSSGSEDKIFDPGITINRSYSF